MNCRAGADVRAQLAAHSGRTFALDLPFARAVFRIGADGAVCAASPLVEPDARITPAAPGGGDVRVEGEAKLLDALSALWRRLADAEGGLAEITGAPLAAELCAAGKEFAGKGKNILREGFFAGEDEVEEFNRRVRAFCAQSRGG